MHAYNVQYRVALDTCMRAFCLLQLSWLDIFAIHMPSSLITGAKSCSDLQLDCSCLFDKAAVISMSQSDMHCYHIPYKIDQVLQSLFDVLTFQRSGCFAD